MATTITGHRRPTKPKKQASLNKRKRDDVDVAKLQQAVDDLDTKESFTKFSDLPLSEPTKAGLKACHFSDLTDIQAKAIALALKGSDILGAAKTGSGKTLAFLIPVLENLYRSQCVGMDAGLGAMIISPTRELAIQIFDVLYKIGKCGHLFAAGLVIGGKSLQEEQHALARMNIVVCTPGRMLQHLSQTAAFNIDNLQMLVLDEADRILDMGFQRDVDAIVDYLPPSRQTLLFSATQTKKVSDLARLSLRDPEYVSVHEAASSATPKTLQQNYVLTPLPTKLDTLWSFIQASKKSKLLVFLSSGKQVRFVYEAFRKMQPGIPLLHLHGRQKQTARLDITTKFAASKHSCLFATDVVARGLDFPAVDWVVQVDCPEDADTYIHRVGRTARYERDGRAVLFLDPSEEEGMLSRLETKKVPLERINVRQKKQTSIRNQLQGMCFKDPELKYIGQKAFTSYVKSLHVQKDKEIFDINKYDLEGFAASLGLPGAPRIRFMKGDAEAMKALKNAPRQAVEASDSEDEDAAAGAEKDKKPRTKYDRMFERRNQDVLSSHYDRMKAAEDDEEQGEAPSPSDERAATNGSITTETLIAINGDEKDDDLFTVKKRIPAEPQPQSTDADDDNTPLTILADSAHRKKALTSKARTAKLLTSVKDPRAIPKHVIFTDDTGGTRDAKTALLDDTATLSTSAAEAERRAYVAAEAARVKARDVEDKALEKAKRKAKLDRKRQKEREARAAGREVVEEGSDDGESDGGDRGSDGGRGGLEVNSRAFEELADLYSDRDSDVDGGRKGESSDDGGQRPRKKTKTKTRKKQSSAQRSSEGLEQSLEDLEAMAQGLLG